MVYEKQYKSELFPNGIKPADVAANMTPFNMALCYKIRKIETKQNWCTIEFTLSHKEVWEQHCELLREFGFRRFAALPKKNNENEWAHYINNEYGDNNYWLSQLLAGLHGRFNAMKALTQLGGVKQNPEEKKFFDTMYTPGAKTPTNLPDMILKEAMQKIKE